MPNPWDIPPSPPIGDIDGDAISIAVGRALTSWEYVEEAYADIFSVLVGAHQSADPEIIPALRAYGAVITSRGRAEMIEAAGRRAFLPPSRRRT
jgi:hypothetical protein